MVSAKGNEKAADGGTKLKRRLICSDGYDEEEDEPLVFRLKRKKEPVKFPPHSTTPKVEGMSADELERTPEVRRNPEPVAGTHAKECYESGAVARTPRDGAAGGKHKRLTGNSGTRTEEVSSKKDLSASDHPRSGAVFSLSKANCTEGGEPFWDKEDFGLTWVKSKSLISPDELSKLESKDDRSLLGCIANDCVKALGATVFFESRLQKYRDRLSDVEKEVKRLAEENANLKESLQKGKDEQRRLVLELDTERSTGASFLQSEAGRQHRVSVEMLAVRDFMKSADFEKLVKEWAATRV